MSILVSALLGSRVTAMHATLLTCVSTVLNIQSFLKKRVFHFSGRN